MNDRELTKSLSPRLQRGALTFLIALGLVLASAALGAGARDPRSSEKSETAGSPAISTVGESAAAQRPGSGTPALQVTLGADTGTVAPGADDEVRAMVQELAKLLNRSSEGLHAVEHPGGMLSIDLKGHFLNVYLARLAGDGTLTGACVSNTDGAQKLLQPAAPRAVLAAEKE